MSIAPDELTRLRLYQSEVHAAAEKAGDYRRYLSKQCDHPKEAVEMSKRSYSNGFGRWRDRSFERCTVCGLERHWGPGSSWFEYTGRHYDD